MIGQVGELACYKSEVSLIGYVFYSCQNKCFKMITPMPTITFQPNRLTNRFFLGFRGFFVVVYILQNCGFLWFSNFITSIMLNLLRRGS